MVSRLVVRSLLLVGCAGALFAVSPTVTSISPASVTQGNPGFLLTVNGANFVSGDVITVDDFLVPTVFISSTKLTGSVPARFMTSPGQLPIAVRDAANNASYSIMLVIVQAPSVVSASPQDVDAGSPAFTLTVVGSHFVPGCTVRIGATSLVTTFLNTSQLAAFVPASLLLSSGRFAIGVVAPDGPITDAGALIVKPILTSLGNVQINGNQVTLDATGFGFVPANFVAMTAAGVQLNLPTSFVSSTRLRATATAGALLAGSGQFNVAQPDGANSQFLAFALPLAINSFAPGGAIAGGPSFTLVISGGIFPPGSLALWNGAPLITSVSSLTQVTATVPASLIASAGVVSVQILHPNGTMAGMPFAINSGVTISGISPNSATPGGPAFSLTLTGGGFLPGAVVRWNGVPLPTVVISSTQLTASVSAALIAEAGSATIGVVEAAGALSNQVPFVIAAPPAAAGITGLTPSAAIAGGASLLLTVNGTGFAPGSTVLWNGAQLATTFVSGAQLSATVPAALIAASGEVKIAVNSGSTVSSTAIFTVLSGPPVSSSAAIVNLGSQAPLVAPGSLIAIYGAGLATAPSAARGVPLPNTLNNVSVMINGIPAPLLYVSPSQINAQVPFEAPPGFAGLLVNVGGVASAPMIFQLAPIGPGVWTLPATSRTLAVNAADGSLIMPAAPVAPGAYVTVYLTGQGALNSPVPTGGAAPDSPLYTPAAPVAATVGGVAANVVSALAPGLVGVLQVNLQIPAVSPGDQPLVITIGGVPSNVTLLAIATP